MFFKRRKLSELIRNAFKVESLEPRILLSADPVFAGVQVASANLLDDKDNLNAFHERYTLDDFQQLNQLNQQVSAYDRPEADSDFVVDDVAFDMANIASSDYQVGGDLIIRAGEILGGSGNVQLNLINEGTLSPGYSPGLVTYDSFSTIDEAEVLIELEGTEAGTEYDQINVINNVEFGGALKINLLNGYVPSEGDVFTIMTFGSSSGAFDSISGLAIEGTDLYFDLEQNAGELKLITRSIDESFNFIGDVFGSEQRDQFGQFLNVDYFGSTVGYSFTGDLSFSGINLTGDVQVTYDLNYSLTDAGGVLTDYSVWNLYVDNASATVDVPGNLSLSLNDFDLALSYITTDKSDDDHAWLFAKGAAAGASSGLSDSFNFSATDISFDFAKTLGTNNDQTLNLSLNPISNGDFHFSDGVSGDRFQISGKGELDLSGQALTADVDLVVDGAADSVRFEVENGALDLNVGADGTGLSLSMNDIAGGFLLDEFGVAGVLRAGDLALTQLDGSALPGLAINKVNSVNVGFNTRGQAVTETLGSLYFDYSEDRYHDFFAVNADLDLGLSVEALAYNLSGQFGFTKTQMELVEGEAAQDVLLMSVLNGETSLAVGGDVSAEGEKSGGAMVTFSGLQGAGLIANIAGEYGAAGLMTVGSVALTETDGVTPLVADLSLLPVNLPFNFNLFDLDPNLNLSLNLPTIDLSLAAFPYVDMSLPGMPSLNLPDLDISSLLPNVDLPNLSLPELGFALPELGLPEMNISFPDVDLGWPYLSLAELNLAYPDLNLDWPSLSFPQLMFALPRLNLPGLKFDFNIEGLSPDWPTMGWDELNLHLATLDLPWPDVAWSDFNLDAIKLALPDLDLPDLDFDWADMKLPDLLLSIKMLQLPGMDISFPEISLSWPDFNTAFPAWPEVGFPEWTLPEFIFALDQLNLPGLNIDFPGLDLPWPTLNLPELSAAFPDLNIDWPNLTLPELMFALPRL
ncbi:LEPR-XLL domain-containing protein, partial [Oceanospirillum sanctuarii]|uniref:LEPR-XLL domain-containing protein n=1 Tax=Oceanospirillum sanctuarii TaxID=1434821 RepID=UPI000A38F209